MMQGCDKYLHSVIKMNSGVPLELDVLLDMYLKMRCVRCLEERTAMAYTKRQIRGFCHLYIGQEAVAGGIYLTYKKGADAIITAYRCHGISYMWGTPLQDVIGELMGKRIGCSKGKGGSMHLFNPSSGFYGGHGIVGASSALGTGLAFGQQYKNSGGVTWCMFGDGALNQGQFFESLNMAGLWKLPIVYVIENNRYAMGTSVSRSTSQMDLYRRGEGWDIPGCRVDGMNLLEVYDACAQAQKYALTDGPIILEMDTYRYRGHSVSDPARYRAKSEVKGVQEDRDPISCLHEHLSERGIDAEKLDELDVRAIEIVSDAFKIAQEAATPDDDDLWKDVYYAR